MASVVASAKKMSLKSPYIFDKNCGVRLISYESKINQFMSGERLATNAMICQDEVLYKYNYLQD
jgi:hypothetical protein